MEECFAYWVICRKSDKPHSFSMNNQVQCQAGQAEASRSLYYLESCRTFGVLHLSMLKKTNASSASKCF